MIQPADKGSGICIFDREDYETEANRQLQDTLENEQGQKEHYYKKVPEKTIKDQFNLIKETLEEGVKNKYITKDFARNLLPQKPKAGSFYLLGKVHKQFERIPKGRPIISGCGTNTERISWLCDQMGKEFVKKQSSFIEDTPDLLRYFKEINENKSLPANCKPIALDLKSMYSNIPTEEGIETFRIELEKRQDKSIPTDFLIKLLRLVLQSNVFEFNKEFWIQLLGTAMGTRAAPTYANIFMGNLENEMLNNCPRHLRTLIFDWKRFIDDILLLFLGTLEELDELYTYLNSYHPTMKFDNPEYDEQNNSTNFLDLKIKIVGSEIFTDLHRKETDKPTALLPSSSHPGHIAPNIVYSMAFRLLRICSTEEKFEFRLKELKQDFLIPRGYKPKVIDYQFSRVKGLPGSTYEEKRFSSLEKQPKEDKNKDRIIVPIDYNPHMAKPTEVMRKHYNAMIKKNKSLEEIFPAPPMPALRQPPNLRRILCGSKLNPVKRANRVRRGTHKDAPGWKKCGKPCHICPFTLPDNSEVVSQVTGYRHRILDPVNCDSSNCIYYWRCTKPNCPDFPECEYVGMTSRMFKERMGEHRDYPKRDVLTEPAGEHFTSRGHNVADLKGQVLEKVRNSDPFVLRARESMLIRQFDSFRHGLNKEP